MINYPETLLPRSFSSKEMKLAGLEKRLNNSLDRLKRIQSTKMYTKSILLFIRIELDDIKVLKKQIEKYRNND